MAREQAQVAFQNGTKKWRYKGVSADGRTKQKGVIEAQTRDQAIDRVNKLGLIPTELVDVNAGTGLNTNIEIKAFEKYPSKKTSRLCHVSLPPWWRQASPDSRTEYRY
ncbi:MAG: hypothetical protein ACLSUZ_00890 [Bifidobacterium pseudocatenulatum]